MKLLANHLFLLLAVLVINACSSSGPIVNVNNSNVDVVRVGPKAMICG